MPWEHAVAACLRALCVLLAGRTSHAAMIDAFRAVPLSVEAVVVHTRLGLCVAELAEVTNPVASQEITADLVRLTARAHDAHAAAELLDHRVPGSHGPTDREVLTNIVEASGLAQRMMPPDLSNALATAADYASTTLATLVAERRPGGGTRTRLGEPIAEAESGQL